MPWNGPYPVHMCLLLGVLGFKGNGIIQVPNPVSQAQAFWDFCPLFMFDYPKKIS